MSNKAQELFLKIIQHYNRTHEKKIHTMDISYESNLDTFFYELESNGLIEFHIGVAPYITLTEKTIYEADIINP